MRSKQQPRPSYRWLNKTDENGKCHQSNIHSRFQLFRMNFNVTWIFVTIECELKCDIRYFFVFWSRGKEKRWQIYRSVWKIAHLITYIYLTLYHVCLSICLLSCHLKKMLHFWHAWVIWKESMWSFFLSLYSILW